jgi:hypothetical protein
LLYSQSVFDQRSKDMLSYSRGVAILGSIFALVLALSSYATAQQQQRDEAPVPTNQQEQDREPKLVDTGLPPLTVLEPLTVNYVSGEANVSRGDGH